MTTKRMDDLKLILNNQSEMLTATAIDLRKARTPEDLRFSIWRLQVCLNEAKDLYYEWEDNVQNIEKEGGK